MCSLAAKSALGPVTKGQGPVQCAVLDRLQPSDLSLWVTSPADPSLETPSTNPSVSSVAQSCPTLCNPMIFSTLGLPVHHQLPKFTQTHVHWVGDAIQTSHPLSSPSPPAFNLSQNQGLFQWVNSSHQVATVLKFQPQHPSFQCIFRIDSFGMDWLDLLAVQETLKSLLQHHSSKASILWHLAFFIVQLSHPYMTTGKTIALTTQTLVGKLMSLLFNMLSLAPIQFTS